MQVSLRFENGLWRVNQFPNLDDLSDEPARIQELIDGMIAPCGKSDAQAAQEFLVPLARAEYFMMFKQHPEAMPMLAKSLASATISSLGPAKEARGPLPMTMRHGEIELPTPDGKTRMPIPIVKINDTWFFERF